MANRAEILKQKFTQSLGLPFCELLPQAEIEQVLAEENVYYRNCLYTPVVTVWAFLSQVLEPDKSMRKVVSRVIAWLSSTEAKLPSSDTGAYSKARSRLPENVLKRLFLKSATGIEAQVNESDLWCGRRVRGFDGTGVIMSDTAANQAAYPQHSNQREGCGFPLIKVVAMFSLCTGAVLEVMLAPFNTSELVLARTLYQQLQPGDVALADSAFGTFADMVLVQQAGADAVFRKQHARKTDFRRGKKLGIADHIVTWYKPRQLRSMSAAALAELPETLKVREIHFQVYQKGFRPKEIVVVTTLLDPKQFSRKKLAQLYQQRWQATEVNLKHIKTSLKMEMLLGKTPEMVRKDLWAHLLAYNLLRQLMWEAAEQFEVSALRISLQGCRQYLNSFVAELASATAKQRQCLYNRLLQVITEKLVPLRPNRVEPRVKKRRPKNYPRMRQPRSVLKAKLTA